MWASAKVFARSVAVMTEHPEAGREGVADEPPTYLVPNLVSVLPPSAVYMINGKEFILRFSATSTNTTVGPNTCLTLNPMALLDFQASLFTVFRIPRSRVGLPMGYEFRPVLQGPVIMLKVDRLQAVFASTRNAVKLPLLGIELRNRLHFSAGAATLCLHRTEIKAPPVSG